MSQWIPKWRAFSLSEWAMEAFCGYSASLLTEEFILGSPGLGGGNGNLNVWSGWGR